MSEKGNVLFLSCLFEEIIGIDELKKICRSLHRNRIISSDLTSKTINCPLSQALVESLHLSKVKNWPRFLIQEIRNLNKPKLDTVVKEVLKGSKSDLLWIIKNWRDLTLSPHTFDDADWFLQDNKSEKVEQLFDIAFDCAQAECDSGTLKIIIVQLKMNLSKHIPQQKSGKSHMMIDPNLLRNLEPMLSSEMTIQQIMAIAKRLQSNKIIYKDAVKKVEVLHNSPEQGCESKAFTHIIDGICKTTNNDWEKVLKQSINDDAGRFFLCHIFDACLNHKEAVVFQWIALSWKKLKSNREMVCSTFQNCFQSSRRFTESEWLLKITHYVMGESSKHMYSFMKQLSWQLKHGTAPPSNLPSQMIHTSHNVSPPSLGPTKFGDGTPQSLLSPYNPKSLQPMFNPNQQSMFNPNQQPMVDPNQQVMVNPNQQAMFNPNQQPMNQNHLVAIQAMFMQWLSHQQAQQLQSATHHQAQQLQSGFGQLPIFSPAHAYQLNQQLQGMTQQTPPSSTSAAVHAMPMDVDCKVNMEDDADTTIDPPSLFNFADGSAESESGFDELSKERAGSSLGSSTTPPGKFDYPHKNETKEIKDGTAKTGDITSNTTVVTHEKEIPRSHQPAGKDMAANKPNNAATNVPQHKQKTHQETNQGQGHDHNLRSRGNQEIQVLENMTCMPPYKCKDLGAIKSPEPKSGEKILEIRVIADGGLKDPDRMFVYVDNLKTQFPLHEDSAKPQCYHTFICVSEDLAELTYKYLTKTSGGDNWETLPKNYWENVVNRKRKLKTYDGKKNYILFDVCKISSETIQLGAFNSLHAKHMQKHLPASKVMQLSASNTSFRDYHDHIDQWWTSASFGIEFSTMTKCYFETTCNEKLRKYLENIPEDTTPLTFLGVHLAICSLICKFKITPPLKNKEFFEKIRSGLNISKLNDDDYINMYAAVHMCKEKESQVLNGVLCVLENTNFSPNCFLLLPLIYIFMNNGECNYNEETWNQMKSRTRLMQLISNLRRNATPSKKLHKKVKELAAKFPDFPKLYQEIFTVESICKLLDEDAEFFGLFDGTKVFELILAKSPIVTEWIYESLRVKIMDSLVKGQKIDKTRIDVNSIFTQVLIKLDGSKNLSLLAWALALIFLLPQDKQKLSVISFNMKTKWIEKDDDKHLNPSKIQVLNRLVDLQIADEETAEMWKTEVKVLLQTFFLEKLKADENFIHNFDNTSQLEVVPNNVVNSCFYEAIASYIEDQAKNKRWYHGITDTLSRNSGILGVMKDSFFKMWTAAQGNVVDKVLLLLHHQVAFSYFRFAGNDEATKGSKSHEALNQFRLGLSLALDMFKTGTISVKNLMEIIESEETFLIALSVLTQDSNVDKYEEDKASLKVLFQIREKELATLENFQEVIHHFVEMCQSVAQGSLQGDWLLDDITNAQWCGVMKCYDDSVGEHDPNTPPEIILFGLTAAQIQAMKEIRGAKMDKNKTIWSRWKQLYNEALQKKKTAGEEQSNLQLSIDDVTNDVWNSMVAEFGPLKQRLTQGTLLLSEVESIFDSSLSKPEVTNLLEAILRFPKRDLANNSNKDLFLTTVDDQNLQTLRSNQICDYFSLKKQQKNISTFMAIKDCLTLEGDFSILEIMEDQAILSNEKALGSITKSVMKAGNLLKGVTKEQCALINNFLVQGALIEWLKIMKDRSEVKVMSDLAMISAGESVKDVDRVSCFLSAVMGFAPFIFDLKNDSGLQEVIEAVQKVWEQKERDPKLLAKWEATASSLEWLKGIKDFHGSVEKSSLLKTQNINANGIYIIGGGGKIPTVYTSVKLVWHKRTIQDDVKDMTLTDLQDLQSRLMLIEDKGLKDVQLFIDTLSLVENLAQAYVDLKVAGCLLFSDWTVKIKNESETEDEQNMGMQINFDVNSPPENLSAKRSDFYHLNHFNIQQITYLCHELAHATVNKNLPDQVYTLLSVIKHDVTHADVSKCLGEVSEKIEEANVADEETPEPEEPDEISDVEQRRKLVRKLINDDVSLSVAKAGVQQAQDLDYDEVFMWCLDNENEDDMIGDLATQFDSDIGLADQTTSVGVVESVIKDKSTLSIMEVINKLLNEEAKNHRPSVCVNTICRRYMEEDSKTSLADCISLDHLGKFLSNISLLVDASTLPNRNVPAALVENVNLVMCPEPDTFTTLISIYMNSPDQPLPTASEVLLCTNQTTQNDVNLLLRRAVASMNGKRIYCLVHTEKLDFEVANSVQITLTQLKKENPSDFTLVIMCCDQRHYIASLFHEQKVDYTTQNSQEDVKLYLKEKLNVKDQTPGGHQTALLVTSQKAGLGKSLYISRLKENLAGECHRTTVRFLEKDCKPDMVLSSILKSKAKNTDPHFVHLDVTPSVNVIDQLLLLLPTVTCLSPQQVLDGKIAEKEAVGMDEQAFSSETFQRPYQYLKRHQKKENLDNFNYIKTILDPVTGKDQDVANAPEGSPIELLQTLLHYCSVKDPSWSETRHFASFLSCQLRDCEKSVFCQAGLVGHDSGLTGFKNFVVKFMIRMSQDFATPSLDDASQGRGSATDVFDQHQLRRSWEQSNHPYLFFNEDRMSMTFLNFKINPNGDLLASKTNQLIEKAIMDRKLVKGLQLQRVNLQQNFDDFSRLKKLETLYQVFGIRGSVKDPDPTYELTTDNVVKMLAIHMRFRCDIPVIIMGETGCGKTRMVEFMSKLKATGVNAADCKAEDMIRNMVIVKVHGGITVEHIQKKVLESSDLAEQNKDKTDTLLFLDEANTTEAIYAIKEFVCDGSVCGKMIKKCGLNIVAACNPYRKHSPEAIKRMENAGLGFKVKTDDTTDKLGEIPMRCLVYRVIALPPSMHPLVWDFGQLKDVAEKVYIEQMVEHKSIRECLSSQRERNLIVHVLTSSQAYMRKNRQECLFVSLRDVERCLVSFKWFFHNRQWLFNLHVVAGDIHTPEQPTLAIKALIQAVGMCYHVTLSERTEYRKMLSDCLAGAQITMTETQIDQEIVACQSVFLKAITLGGDIASNEALRENVFMIVMCSEMRIPLFLIGKPGSSKSLAKTIVTDAMQGQNSNNEVFQKLKQIHVLSFQCSPVTDAVGIESVFKQCASLQEKQDATKFVAVVVLDEIGLAEDSPKMPLKVLHPLLESGVTNSELTTYDNRQNENEMQKRVGFVGISNWALDPAKMNRGLFVHRGAPTEDDLQLTAKGIFSSDTTEYEEVSKIVDAVTKSYLQIEEERKNRHNVNGGDLNLCDREFFGLRDYYGLLKMIYAVFCDEMAKPRFYDVFYAVQRNFNGAKIDCLPIFTQNFKPIWPNQDIPEVTLENMIQDNLRLQDEDDTHFCETRYLLLMTNHLAAVDLLGNITETQKFEVVFGSSFPQDNNYTEKCRNINRIKMCMEAGNTVLLLNLKDLYESLYDALNQHYVTFAGQRYVDLGLGGHRVKCRVHKNFRLIVMENQNVVYNEFPIPLINRLEKHIFTTKSLLNPQQKSDAQRLEEWVGEFSELAQSRHKEEIMFTRKDSFVGYMEDTAGSAVMTAGKGSKTYEAAQTLLLNTATCDSVLRLPNSGLKKEASKWQRKYFDSERHDNLFGLLKSFLEPLYVTGVVLIDVTSFSHILSDTDRKILENSLDLQKNAIMLITLQQFKTADEFSEKLRNFIAKIKSIKPTDDKIQSFVLLIQCPQAHTPLNLTACAKYAVKNVLQNQDQELKSHNARLIVAFLFTVERHCTQSTKNQVKSYISTKWINVFVDELRVTTDYLGPPSRIRNMKLGELFASGARGKSHETLAQKTLTNFADPDFRIDLHLLLCHSLSLALTKLKPDFVPADSNRFRYLLAAFSTDDLFCREFVKLIKHNIVDLANERDSQLMTSNWISNLAASSTALQEGGSFTKTLWLYLKKIASTMLAYIISEADEDQNLDILWCSRTNNLKQHLKTIWLKLFTEKTVCGLAWDNYDKVQQFVVKGSENFICQFPFSRKIVRLFQKHWELLQHQKNASEHFNTKIKSTKLNGLLRTAFETEASQVLTCFVHDLVYLHYRCGSGDPLEYQLIVDVLINIYGQKQTDYDDDVAECSNVPALLFVLITRFSQQLKQVASILKVFPSILTTENVALWLKKQTGKTTITIQLELFSSALDLIKEKSDKLKSVDDYHRWAALIREIGPVAEAILHFPETETQQKTWKALAFGALFLEQLVPAGLNEEAYRGYIEVLLPSSKRLWKGALKVGLNNEKYLNTLVKNLNGSVNKIRLMCLLDWQEIACKHCKRPTVVDPVILPCKHFMCHRCTDFLLDERSCPTCRANIPADFVLQPSVFSPEQKSDMDVLSGNCTSFFLEYLSTLCFPAPGSLAVQTDAKKHVTDALHNLVIQDKTTRKMSPLQSSALDDTPTVRSFILQLLLRYDRTNIQDELESHFTAVGQVLENKQELMMVYIRCIEDSLHQQVANMTMPHLLQEQISKVQDDDFDSQLQHLDVVANLRYILQMVIDQVFQELTNKLDFPFLYNNIDSLSEIGSENVKIFIIKSFCRRYGIGMFSQLMKHEHFKKLIPQCLHTNCDDKLLNQTSMLAVAGEAVESTKQKLNEIVHEDIPVVLDAIFTEVNQQSAVQVALGTLSWSRIESETVGNETKLSTAGSILKSLQQNSFISINIYNTANELLHQLPTIRKEGQFVQHIILELIMTAVMATASCSDNLLAPLNDLGKDQHNVCNKFLPTMPQTSFFEVKALIDSWISRYHKPPQTYFCPNNHPYLVGDCTKVVFTGTLCPDCKAPIGGTGKKEGDLMPGNKAGEMTEASQAGYKLPQPEDRDLQSNPERQCNKLSVCVIRFLLHSNLLINAANSNVQSLFGVTGINEAKKIILSHLEKDLQQLANSMGKSVEDSALLLHQIFKHIAQSKEQNNNVDVGFSSMKMRQNWETDFQRTYLVPIFAKADKMITEARNLILDAKQQSDLEKLVFEIPNGEMQAVEVGADIVPWNHPSLWQYHINITLAHLRQTLSGIVTSKTDEGAVLQLILESTNLPVLCHLELILEIQTALVERYQQRVDINDVNTITVENYLSSNDCIISEDKFNIYLNLWNERKHQLKLEIGSHLPNEYFEDLTLNSPVSMFLPSKVDRGQCALLFTQYVLQQQNKLIIDCAEMLKPRPTFEEVKISQLSSNDIISIENEQVFLPYVLANSQYEATMTPSGSKHEIVYRIPALEKQILQRYIMHKKLIDEASVQCMEFLQDTGMAKEFSMLQKNVKQVKLPIKLFQKLEDLKGTTTMPAICEAVRTLTLVVKYLSKMKSDEKMDLNTYIRKDLMLSPEEAELIPNSSKLCHTRALFEWFAWQRSIKKCLLHQDPFCNIVKPEDQELIEDEANIREFLSQINVEELQVEINSLLIMKAELNAEAGLKDYLDPFADERDVELRWIDQMPEEILVKHAVHLFKISVQ